MRISDLLVFSPTRKYLCRHIYTLWDEAAPNALFAAGRTLENGQKSPWVNDMEFGQQPLQAEDHCDLITIRKLHTFEAIAPHLMG